MSSNPARDATLDAIARLLGSGRAAEAEAAAATLLRETPDDAEALRLRAIAELQLGRASAARATLHAALTIAPASIEILCNLGSVELAAGDAATALAVLDRAFVLAPAHPAVLIGLGNARRANGDVSGAVDAYAAATRASPQHAGAWLNLAAAELALGAASDAERNARHALVLAPSHPEGLLLLGHVLAAQRRFTEAEAAYAGGARAAPNDARFPYQIGLMAEEQKRLADAAAAHARALTLDRSLHHALGQLVFLKRQLCDWRDLDALSMDLRARVAQGAVGIAPFAFLAEPAEAREQLQCARTFAAGIESKADALRAHRQVESLAPSSGEPRIGFVSNGFGSHPTGLLIVALIEALHEEPLHVQMFSTAADDASAIGQRLRAAADGWHEVAGLAPIALADRLRDSCLDVLIDLRGYGGGGIAEALALRPAPVQVNWLAYPGTSGAPWIDYVIADRVVLPETLRAHFSERVAYLPRCFQPSDSSRMVGEPPSRSDCGLPDAGCVFVSFNNSYKLNPASMQRMFAVLHGVPDSVLWLLSGPEGADDRLRDAARASGIDPARLVSMPKLPHDEYLARYRHADLFLDTQPYNAHTTASDAIWAGCPVLTVPGATFAARVAASLNAHLGMPQLNARDDADFVDIAVRFGRDSAARAHLRAELAAKRAASGLFDMQGFARDFTALLGQIVERHRSSQAPGDIG